MTINEMHVWFRQYAQQMGMQNVRAILPEQIDVLINTSISDIITQIIGKNVNLTTSRSTESNSKLGQINLLRTIYKVKELNIGEPDTTSVFAKVSKSLDDEEIDYLYLVDFAIQYAKDEVYSQYFPVRLVDENNLAETFTDYNLRPRIVSPICTVVGNEVNVYIDKVSNIGLTPSKLKVSYIRHPAKVDLANNVDCDLPNSLHTNIIMHAADLYRIAVSGALYATPQQNQTEQQNNNNSRNQ